jgi:hypothetical protein
MHNLFDEISGYSIFWIGHNDWLHFELLRTLVAYTCLILFWIVHKVFHLWSDKLFLWFVLLVFLIFWRDWFSLVSFYVLINSIY